jgi:hypothetical protein
MTIQNEINFSKMICFGVAGNFAGHLVQAGEMGDFTHIACVEESAPKGIFPFYLPCESDNTLSIFPISNDTLHLPKDASLQAEPECALICDVVYEDGKVIDLKPKLIAAFNDCSIRKDGAAKISEKKNWGECSKGISSNLITVDKFSAKGMINNYNLVSYVKRKGQFCAYGIDSPLQDYSYFYSKLISWLINQINTQKDEGPLEDIQMLMKECNYPTEMLISVGSTCYTPFGENDRLQAGDEIYIILYPHNIYNNDDIRAFLEQEKQLPKDVSMLIQKVVDRVS